MRVLLRIGMGLLVCLFAFGAWFAWETLRPRTVLTDLPQTGLQTGDVVLMRSHTWRAELVRLIDGQSRADGYSHVGILHSRDAQGEWQIVHAVPGEGGTVRREPWSFVAKGGGSTQALVLRAQDLNTERLVAALDAHVVAATPFDTDFDHHDDAAIYCTELVTTLFARSGVSVPEAMLAKRAIFPGDLAASAMFVRVVETP